MKKILIILTLIYFSSCVTMCESEDIPKDLNDCDVREVQDPNNSCCYVEFDDQKFCKEAKDTESIPTPEGVQRRVVGCHRKKNINTGSNYLKVGLFLIIYLLLF